MEQEVEQEVEQDEPKWNKKKRGGRAVVPPHETVGLGVSFQLFRFFGFLFHP